MNTNSLISKALPIEFSNGAICLTNTDVMLCEVLASLGYDRSIQDISRMYELDLEQIKYALRFAAFILEYYHCESKEI